MKGLVSVFTLIRWGFCNVKMRVFVSIIFCNQPFYQYEYGIKAKTYPIWCTIQGVHINRFFTLCLHTNTDENRFFVSHKGDQLSLCDRGQKNFLLGGCRKPIVCRYIKQRLEM